MTWEYIYNYLGITDFINFISSSDIQNALLPIKIVFILFTVFFFCAVMYFYVNSSYIKYQFLQDTSEFLYWQPYELKGVNKRWKNIIKRIESGLESDYKLAIIEADDLLRQSFENRGYEGETFEELANKADKRIMPNFNDILEAHAVRNSVVYNSDYKLDLQEAKKILSEYEKAIKSISIS